MSRMDNQACCTIPPVEAKYTAKGETVKFAGMNTYAIGPKDAKGAVVIMYDIFGITPQAQQGADLLSSAGLRVYMPDVLEGNYAQPSWFSGSEEGNKAKAEFFSAFPGKATSHSETIAKCLASAKENGHEKVGAFGLCWGYKAIVSAKDVGQFSAIASAHPSFAAKEDYDNITSPICLLPSANEDMTVMRELNNLAEAKHQGQNVLKQYEGQHGFAAARADLSNEKQRAEFQDAYQITANFFKKFLA